MKLAHLFEEIDYDIKTAKQLGIEFVYRTETPDPYYKGKAIWGKGKYFSMSKEESERINAGGEIKQVKVPADLKLAEFDLTWHADRERSNRDYKAVHALLGKDLPGLDGLVVLSNSLQYGYSQMVVFPASLHKLKY
jgi:hypothetical protein